MADTERASHPETPETDRAAALIGHLSTLRTTGPMLADAASRVPARLIDGIVVFVFMFATDIAALPSTGSALTIWQVAGKDGVTYFGRGTDRRGYVLMTPLQSTLSAADATKILEGLVGP